MLETYEYHRPADLEEACRLLEDLPQPQLLAGGTDLLYDIDAGLRKAQHVVSLQDVRELQGIDEADDHVAIGAGCTAREIHASPIIEKRFPEIAEMVVTFASPQIRTRATVAGNICSAVPCGDFPVILMALGASIELVSAAARRKVALADFFTGPRETLRKKNELLARILVPVKQPRSGSCFMKYQRRASNSLAVASVASFVRIDGGLCREARVVLGAVAPIPLLAKTAGAALVGQRWNEDTVARAAGMARDDAQPITDVRGTEKFRRHLVHVLTGRTLRRAAERAGALTNAGA
ncbi:MAG: xanthine dehydrogenase family protein subunit M [bacterium]